MLTATLDTRPGAMVFTRAICMAFALSFTACAASDGGAGDQSGGGGGHGENGEPHGGEDESDAGGAAGAADAGGGGGEAGSMQASTGGATAGAGGSGGSPTPTCPQGNICDDFEANATGMAPMGWARSNVVTVSTDRAFSGEKSILLELKAGAANKMVYVTKRGGPLFPVSGNRLFGRMMVYFESMPNDAHVTNIQAEGMLPGKTYGAQYRYGVQGGRIMANYDNSGVPSDCFKHSGVNLPVKQWTCYQWEFNGPENEMRFWFNGEEVDSMHVRGFGHGCVSPTYKDPWFAPAFESVSIGWHAHQDSGPQKMWVDDVALGATPTPCPPLPPGF